MLAGGDSGGGVDKALAVDQRASPPGKRKRTGSPRTLLPLKTRHIIKRKIQSEVNGFETAEIHIATPASSRSMRRAALPTERRSSIPTVLDAQIITPRKVLEVQIKVDP